VPHPVPVPTSAGRRAVRSSTCRCWLHYGAGMSYHRRLATLLGVEPAEATADDVRRLVNNPEAAEGQDLEYKRQPHDSGTKGSGELAKDVAAFANGPGGVIILGLQESNTAIPAQEAPIELTDGLKRRYHEVLAGRTAPIANCDIHFAKETTTPAGQIPKGFVLVMVPPSPQAPHAVTGLMDPKDGVLRFPIRTGSGTRFLTAAEVETAFLDKQNQRLQREGRHEDLRNAIAAHRSLSESRSRRRQARLLVSLVPHIPGTVLWDRKTFETYRAHLLGERPRMDEPESTFYEVEPLSDGLVAWSEPNTSHQVIAVCADDGSTAAEYPLHIHSPSTWLDDDDEEGTPAPGAVSPGDVTEVVVSALLLLARHAVERAGTRGGCAIRAELVGPWNDSPSPELQRVRLGIMSARRSTAQARTEIGALLEDITQPGQPLIQTADLLLTRLGRHFGRVEWPYTSRDGVVIQDKRTSYFPSALYRWAEREGVELRAPDS